MQRFKKQIAFLFGVIALITYVTVRYFPMEEETTSVVATADLSAHMQVYLMDRDQTLVPISIPVNEEMGEEDKLTMMMGYLSGKQTIKGFSPLFNEEVTLSNVSIADGKVVLQFDDSFLQYEADNELRVLESITWGATQFHDIEQVELQLNQTPLTTMPVANTPIPAILNRSIGINHFETGTSALHSSNELTVFYTKKIKGTTYMVPKTKRYPSTRKSIESKVNEIVEDISVSSTLSQPLVKNQVALESMELVDHEMKVNLNKNILGADKSVKQDVYDSLMLSLLSLDEVEKAQILVDGVVVSLTENDQSVSMQDITYNVVKF